jgi:hypothetical protein
MSNGAGQPEAVALVVADPQMLDELTYEFLEPLPALHSLVMVATDAYMILNYRLIRFFLPPAPVTMHLFIGDLFMNGDLWPTARCARRFPPPLRPSLTPIINFMAL